MTYPYKLCLRRIKDHFAAENASNALVGSNHFRPILDFRVEELAGQFGNSGDVSAWSRA
jgi:hypothetical protein